MNDASTPSAAPHDLDAERYVIGACLVNPLVVVAVVGLLHTPRMFFKSAHQLIWGAIRSLSTKDTPVDIFSVSTQLKTDGDLSRVGGTEYLYDIQESVPSSANADYYAQEVKDAYTRRSLIVAGSDMITLAGRREIDLAQVTDEAQRILFDVHAEDEKRTIRTDVALQDTMAHIEELYKRKDKLLGIPSGFPELDELLFGLNPGDLVILAARPSVGKSALAHNIMARIACRTDEEAPGVLMFSMEMGTEQIMTRVLATVGRIRMGRLRSGNLDREDWKRMAQAGGDIENGKLYFNDQAGLSLLDLRSEARRIKIETPSLGLIIVDYLQLMQGGSREHGNREQEIADYSRSLKQLARELNVCVLALSQLNRAVETRGGDKRPMLSDLRESGAIEQDADIVVFMYRDDYYHPDSEEPGVVELIVRKNRNGPLGTVKVAFDASYMRFTPHIEHP